MKKIVVVFLALSFIVSCNTLKDLSNIQKPSVRYSNTSIEDFSFREVTLLFDFEVNNPNTFGVNAAQYRYEFFINGEEFVTGIQTENLRIERESNSIIQIPVSLSFTEVADAVRSVAKRDSLSYRISSEVEFDIAGIGTQRIPVSAEGELPIPRLPRISLDDFEIRQLSFSGAEMVASFQVENPNPFAISFSDASYNLRVNGNEWLDTTLERSLELGGSESDLISIPLRLNSSQMGTVLFDLINGKKEFDYQLSGSANVSADILGFDGFEILPFDISGTYRLDN